MLLIIIEFFSWLHKVFVFPLIKFLFWLLSRRYCFWLNLASLRDCISIFLDSTINANLAFLSQADIDNILKHRIFCGDQLVGICSHRRSFVFRDIYLVVHHDFTRLESYKLLRNFILSLLWRFISHFIPYSYLCFCFILIPKNGFNIIARSKNSKVMMSNCTSRGLCFTCSSYFLFLFFYKSCKRFLLSLIPWNHQSLLLAFLHLEAQSLLLSTLINEQSSYKSFLIDADDLVSFLCFQNLVTTALKLDMKGFETTNLIKWSEYGLHNYCWLSVNSRSSWILATLPNFTLVTCQSTTCQNVTSKEHIKKIM